MKKKTKTILLDLDDEKERLVYEHLQTKGRKLTKYVIEAVLFYEKCMRQEAYEKILAAEGKTLTSVGRTPIEGDPSAKIVPDDHNTTDDTAQTQETASVPISDNFADEPEEPTEITENVFATLSDMLPR